MPSFTKIIRKLLEDREFVTFYPTYGYREGSHWKIPVRIWVHEPRRLAEKLVRLLADNIGNTGDSELEILATRIADIVADSESLERVIFIFDNDPEQQEWRVRTGDGKQPRSDLNGTIRGHILLPEEKAQDLFQAQNSQDGWLTFRAVSKDHSGIGRVRLIEPEGLSVISDIDDTIKVTEIPAGGKTVVRNTFFRPFAAAQEMAARYRDIGNASFHYVSGAPWQLYRPLAAFIREEGFPEGSFHMKSVPKNLLSPTTWKQLLKLIGDATVDQKVFQIREIMRHFPDREFIFIGDSGEHDPEVYAHLRQTFGNRVREIWIRDLVNARHTDPARLEGMKIIPAPTIQPPEYT